MFSSGMLLSGESAVDSGAYIIEVKTDNAGTSASDQFTLPATGSYTIDWGDGVVESLSGAQTHTYPSAGTYTIEVTGGLTAITFNFGGDRLKLLEIQNWGDIQWTSVLSAYRGCSNMTLATSSAPDLSLVTDATRMFADCTSFTDSLNGLADWDVSTIQSMASMFNNSSVNTDLANWNVSNVTNFAEMFRNCTSFVSDLSAWNVGSATTMSRMFAGCTSFVSDLSGWNVSSVTNMFEMFSNASSFNSDVSDWDISSVTSMLRAFSSTSLSTANLDLIYQKWSLLSVQPSVSASFDPTTYTSAASSGRAVLTGAPNNWTIVDGGLA